MHNYSIIVVPLTSLLSKSKHWIWGWEEQVAFDNIKQAFTTAPVLLIPFFDKQFSVESNISDVAIGSGLL